MSADVTTQGALEVRTYGRSQKAIRLVSCPFCGHDFESHEPRWRHFLEEHDPEDAGLSPLGEHSDKKLLTDGGTPVDDSPWERIHELERHAPVDLPSPSEPDDSEGIDADALALELRAANARSALEHALAQLDELEYANRARYHVREAIGTLDAAQEVDQ